jgi:hypothetical protein
MNILLSISENGSKMNCMELLRSRAFLVTATGRSTDMAWQKVTGHKKIQKEERAIFSLRMMRSTVTEF